ncbi:dienelactone hydrolase family protein [Camelimonas sp. ID_303_24]
MSSAPEGMVVTLEAADGFIFSAYRVEPRKEPRGGVVILQEIFGVNPHIRKVADTYARAGYLAIAPALYDRVAPGAELGYSPADLQKGMELRAQCDLTATMHDIQAAIDDAAWAGKVAVVGYCWGGQLAWRAANAANDLAAAVMYYGGGVDALGDLAPQCPVLGHFGDRDAHIPVDRVLPLQTRYAHLVNIKIYPADHGFNCEARASYDEAAAQLALQRTLAFLDGRLADEA